MQTGLYIVAAVDCRMEDRCAELSHGVVSEGGGAVNVKVKRSEP